jgi:nicotinate-nucleotide adenylyltransferase
MSFYDTWMRLGLFGGSFDPIHLGHLLLAEFCRETSRLDQIWFIPAATPPHKQARPLSPAEHRLAMLNLAIGGHQAMAVSRLELDRGGVSYTIDTLREIHREQPAAELFLLMGADTLYDLPNWREPAEVLRLATPIVVRRTGQSEPDFACVAPLVSTARLATLARHVVPMPLVEIASSDIRRRVADGLSIRFQTPRAVEEYIRTQGLYRT